MQWISMMIGQKSFSVPSKSHSDCTGRHNFMSENGNLMEICLVFIGKVHYINTYSNTYVLDLEYILQYWPKISFDNIIL